MTTALELIEDAFADVGLKESGQSLSNEDAQLGLRRLNRMLATWSQRRLLLPVLTEINVSLTGAASYTIGPTGVVVAQRPIKVASATYIDGSGHEGDVAVLGQYEWDRIGLKDVSGGPPSDVWYEALSTNGRINVYPKATGYTLSLKCHTVLSTFTLVTEVTLPPGYEELITASLADKVCSAFGKATPADVLRRAAAASRAIKAANQEPLLAEVDGSNTRYIIERGY